MTTTLTRRKFLRSAIIAASGVVAGVPVLGKPTDISDMNLVMGIDVAAPGGDVTAVTVGALDGDGRFHILDILFADDEQWDAADFEGMIASFANRYGCTVYRDSANCKE